MEERPIFQFKKPTSRKIGDFDVNDKSEFTLLIKQQYQDFPKFLHFRKLWNVEETDDQVDPDGNIIKRGIRVAPAYEVTMGFVRDDKFVIQDQKQYSRGTYTDIHKLYMGSLKSYVDSGYIKDMNLYSGDEAKVPPYYANERTSLKEAQEAIAKSLQRQVTTMPLSQVATGQQQSGNQMAIAVTSQPTPKNPLLKLKKSGFMALSKSKSNPNP